MCYWLLQDTDTGDSFFEMSINQLFKHKYVQQTWHLNTNLTCVSLFLSSGNSRCIYSMYLPAIFICHYVSHRWTQHMLLLWRRWSLWRLWAWDECKRLWSVHPEWFPGSVGNYGGDISWGKTLLPSWGGIRISCDHQGRTFPNFSKLH